MPKKIVQDIVPQDVDSDSRSIRNIPVTRTKKRSFDIDSNRDYEEHDKGLMDAPSIQAEHTVERSLRSSVSQISKRRPQAPDKYSKYLLWSIVVLAVIVLLFAFSGMFSGAKVIIFPKNERSDISARVLAKKSTNDAELSFKVITLNKEGIREAEASGEQMLETKAAGTIVIYNNLTTAQPLVARTRFQSPNGLIYRILSPVVVPAKKGDVPGTVEVKVTADMVGADYNTGLVDFTIPGFKNDAVRYKNIFAKSRTAMTGGQKGRVKVVKESDVVKMREMIRGELKLELYNQARALVSNDSVLYESAVFIDWTSLPNEETADNKVLIKEKGDLHAIVFKEDHLAEQAARVSMSNAEGIQIANIKDLQFSLIGIDPRPWEKEVVQFNLKGKAEYVWKSDLDAFEISLVGKTTSDLPQILSNFPGIDRAEVVIRPFWKKTFPLDIRKIYIVQGSVDE